jgi:NitT/TauT family transport system substrate-binding protein
MRRGLIRLAVLLGAGLVLPVASVSKASLQAETLVRIAFSQQSVASLPVIVADQRGLFAAEGVKIEKSDFSGGGAAVQSLAGGSSDLCLCAPDHAVRLADRGLGGAVIVALYERNPYALVARAGATFTDLKSLKGRKLGVTASGSLSDSALRFAVKSLGMDPDKDVQVIAMGLGGPMKAALDAGVIDAGMVTTPDTQNLLSTAGAYKVIEDFRQLDYPATDLIAVGSWLKGHDAIARAVARAVLNAERVIQSDPTAIRDAIKQMFPKLKADVAESVAQDITAHGLSRDGLVSRAGYDAMLKILQTADPRVKARPYEDVILTQYLQ